MKSARDEDYTSIIPTAYLTAYPRTLTDIQYAKEIFKKLEDLRKSEHQPELSQDIKIPRLAPELEARFKLIDKLLKASEIKQVLELAAGLSTRGAVIAQSVDQYIELDLKDMAEMKTKLLNQVVAIPVNLHIVAGNALRLEDLEKTVAVFDESQPLAVTHEGLLRYLSFPEKAQVAKNVRALLERFGGAWITCDTTPKKFLEAQNTVTKPGMNKDMISMTGKNYNNNMFNDNKHVEEFFGGLGFTVETHHFTEVEAELTSPKELGLSYEEVKKLLSVGVVVVMRLK